MYLRDSVPKYLLDTVVLSETRSGTGDPYVLRWTRDKVAEAPFRSAATIGELQRGVESQRRHTPDFAEALFSWLDESDRHR